MHEGPYIRRLREASGQRERYTREGGRAKGRPTLQALIKGPRNLARADSSELLSQHGWKEVVQAEDFASNGEELSGENLSGASWSLTTGSTNCCINKINHFCTIDPLDLLVIFESKPYQQSCAPAFSYGRNPLKINI